RRQNHTGTNVDFRDIFLICLRSSSGDQGFDAAEFFNEWFRGYGKCYFFLFSKNLKVTNIQFAELLSLLRCYVGPESKNAQIGDLRFLSVDEFQNAIADIVGA